MNIKLYFIIKIININNEIKAIKLIIRLYIIFTNYIKRLIIILFILYNSRNKY